jgi:tripartite-type tricarboxylate transporter receptor subunit TctC
VTAEPAGGLDLAARLTAPALAANLGQQVIVENRGGAGGVLAAQTIVRAPPDGYSLLFYGSAIWLAPFLRDSVPYDPVKDLAPVTYAVTSPNLLVVHPQLPVKSVRELIALAKARPGYLSYASAGGGGVQHLAAELLKATTKIDIVHIPYKGAGPVMQDLVGGQVQMFFAGMPPAMPHVRSGKLRALAVTTTTRSSAAPQVPTMEEAGVPRFDISNWFGYFVPSATPRDVIGRLNGEIVRALQQQDVREKLAGAGADALGTSPEELGSFMRAESRKFEELIKASGARLD